MSNHVVGTRFSGENRIALLPVCRATWKQVLQALKMSRQPEETEVEEPGEETEKKPQTPVQTEE